MEATAIKRVFTFNGTNLPDPNPNAGIDQVRDVLATSHPELATAAIDGPAVKGDVHTYTFVKSVGTKG
jgi:PRTRC genetic system protein C